jgi:hypothetical protein
MTGKNHRDVSGILMAAVVIVCAGTAPVLAQWPSTRIFRFDIDEKARPHELLPPPPKPLKLGALVTDDLARVPEVQFAEPIVSKLQDSQPMSDVARQQMVDKAIEKATIQTARQLANMNFLNKKRRDLFLETLRDNRPDLEGLPFVTGAAARLPESERPAFLTEAAWIRRFVDHADGAQAFWPDYDAQVKDRLKEKDANARARIAALMQILRPEGSYHAGLVARLAAFGKPAEQQATEALAKLAVFSTDKPVRQAALDGLQQRPAGPATPLLLQGLRYPWPSVAQNAAEAAVQLKRADLVDELIKILEEPDPRAPVEAEAKGQKVQVVRELVRINHLRNCMLCHPSGSSEDIFKSKAGDWLKPSDAAGWVEVEKGVRSKLVSTGFGLEVDHNAVLGVVPIPGQSIRRQGYEGIFLTDVVVRADTTYLRSDFALLHEVADADPWPELQRFDYLVRSRVLTESEAQTYRRAFAAADAVSPYRQAARDALRRLTGKDAGSTAEQWRTALGR